MGKGARAVQCPPAGRLPGALSLGAVLLLLALVLLAGCGSEGRTLSLSGATMGTTWSVQVAQPPESLDPDALLADITRTLAEVNDRMSTYQPDSELSRFNAEDGTGWFEVSPELVGLADKARSVSEQSNGAFDVTVGPLVNLWGFGPEVTADQIPAQADIDAALARVDWRKVETRMAPPALRKAAPDLYVDLSAIAKGHGVDRIADLLAEAGIEHYLAEIGGELRGHGLNAAGEPWRIAIERPDVDRRAVLTVVSLQDRAMATSGDYRNFFELGGRRYSHTIDPATGRPVDHALASVTVLAEHCADADAWATALLVLGPERGRVLADELGLAALFVERVGDEARVSRSRAFEAAAGSGRAARQQ